MSHCQTVEELKAHIEEVDANTRDAVDNGTVLEYTDALQETLVSTGLLCSMCYNSYPNVISTGRGP